MAIKRKLVYDLLMDGSEFLIANGDLVISESTVQHQNHLMVAEKGHYKESPMVGVGILSELLNDDVDINEIRTRIQREFETDGMAIDYLNIDKGKIKVNGGYKF